MPTLNTRDQYGWVSLLLHWLLFVLIVGLIASGKYSDSLSSKDPQIIGIHTQVGIVVLLLMIFRLIWKIFNPGVDNISDLQSVRIIASCTHLLLYFAIMAQAVIGIAMVQAKGRAVEFLGMKIITLAGAFGVLPQSGDLLREWHEMGSYAILGLIGLHVAGVLFHHFYFQDDTLRRMSFGYSPAYREESHVRKD